MSIRLMQWNATTPYTITTPIVVTAVNNDAVAEEYAVYDTGDSAISWGYT